MDLIKLTKTELIDLLKTDGIYKEYCDGMNKDGLIEYYQDHINSSSVNSIDDAEAMTLASKSLNYALWATKEYNLLGMSNDEWDKFITEKAETKMDNDNDVTRNLESYINGQDKFFKGLIAKVKNSATDVESVFNAEYSSVLFQSKLDAGNFDAVKELLAENAKKLMGGM